MEWMYQDCYITMILQCVYLHTEASGKCSIFEILYFFWAFWGIQLGATQGSGSYIMSPTVQSLARVLPRMGQDYYITMTPLSMALHTWNYLDMILASHLSAMNIVAAPHMSWNEYIKTATAPWYYYACVYTPKASGEWSIFDILYLFWGI